MATRLTGFSKLLITLLILAALFFGFRYLMNNTSFGQKMKEKTEQASSDKNNGSASSDNAQANNNGSSNTPKINIPSASDEDGKVLRVQLVTWGGYAPGLYFNEGAKANKNSRFFKDYGFKVEFILNNDLFNALDGWVAGEYDVLVQTADAFPLYTAPESINAQKPRAFMQVDWSRGGDAIIAKRGINTINDLKGKTIAVAVPSPAQTLLISSLEAAGLSYSDVKIVETTDNLLAAEQFRAANVDAAVVWSPDDIIAVKEVAGSKVLVNTEKQSHIIADIMFAGQDFIDGNKQMINQFYEGWMKGVAEMKNQANHKKAAQYLAELNGVSVDDALGMMSTVYWTGHGDNKNFFGLDNTYKGVKGYDLYSKMSKKFVETKHAERVAPNWRSVIYTGAVQNAGLTGAAYAPEKGKNFTIKKEDYTSAPISTKPVSISFNSGQYQLSENAKTIIDLQFADVAKTFGNAKIRIEGNTDNVGARAMNQTLSKKRAKAVASYLQKTYSMNPNRFVIVGNGPDKPVSGCEANQNEACKAKNRRTDFSLIQ